MRLIPVVLSVLSSTAIAATWADKAPQQVLDAEQSEQRQPNFIFIITDDQDLELDSVKYTPLIQEHLQIKGTFFKNHFVTTALCCPSRVSLWTGKQAHNTNVTDVSPPYGMCFLVDGYMYRDILVHIYIYIHAREQADTPANDFSRRLSEICGPWF